MENLGPESNNRTLSKNSGGSFNGDEYGKNLSGIEAKKKKVRGENYAQIRGLMDELFGCKSTEALSDDEIWGKIEGYLQEFKNNSDFVESGNMNLLDKIKNAKDRLEEPLIYEAAAFLLANIEMGGSPYCNLIEYENSGLWVKVLFGKAHYEQFLRDKQKCIEAFSTEENKDELQDALANCEMNYIVNNIRGTEGKFRYFGYDSSKGRASLPSQFADRLSSLSEKLFHESSVEVIHNDFNLAKYDFERLMKSSRVPGALGNLARMLSLSKNEEQKSECQKAFLICMLGGALDSGGSRDNRKQVYLWAKTLGFLPGMLVKNTGYSEQVVALLDDFSEGDFSKHVKSVFHGKDLLKGGMNIGNLIDEIDSWWSVDVMRKFEQYSKSDFLTKKYPFGSDLWRLQRVALKNV